VWSVVVSCLQIMDRGSIQKPSRSSTRVMLMGSFGCASVVVGDGRVPVDVRPRLRSRSVVVAARPA